MLTITEIAKYESWVKSSITNNGYVTGYTIAQILGVDHQAFHDRLFLFYREGQDPNTPLMYWRNRDTGRMEHLDGAYPHSMWIAIGNYEGPTFGITAKQISDLDAIYPSKADRIEIIRRAIVESEK